LSSEASSSPAPLPSSLKPLCMAKATCRFSMEETARAHVWATRDHAVPWPCFCSHVLRHVCPAG
jgi:hypothetical protein